MDNIERLCKARGKIDIGKLQLKLFAGPNGINVLNLVPGKSPTFRPKSPAFNYEDTEESEEKTHDLPSIKIDIDLNESNNNDKSDEETQDDDNVLSSLCKKRPKKPGARPPSRTFVKRLGSSSSNEEVTFIINTNSDNPSVDVADENINDGDIKLSSTANVLSPPSSTNSSLSPTSQEDQINKFPPVKYKSEDTEKQLNITLITKALQDRGVKKKENESFHPENVNSPNNINHSRISDKPNDQIKGKDDISPPHIKDNKGQKPDSPSVPPKPALKKVHAIAKEQKIIKPSEIAKEQRNVRNIENKEQKKKPVLPKEDIVKVKTSVSITDHHMVSENIINEEDISRNNSIENNQESPPVTNTTTEVGKTICVEFKGNKLLDKTVTNECDNNNGIPTEDISLRSRTRSAKKTTENNSSVTTKNEQQTIHRTKPEGTKTPKTILKLDRSQSEIPKLKKDLECTTKTQKEKDELSNKTYLELETLKNINQKANNDKPPQANEKLLDGRKLPTPRNFGSIENVSVKRYQRIETSDYFNYKKSADDVRLKENDKITDIEKNQSSELFKSKADVLKDARTRERSNTRSEGKSNVMYVPYSAGKKTNTTDNLTTPTGGMYRSKSAGARSSEASLLPRFKGTSATTTSSVVTKSNIAKPCASFPTRVLDRFMPKSNTTVETKRSNTTYS